MIREPLDRMLAVIRVQLRRQLAGSVVRRMPSPSLMIRKPTCLTIGVMLGIFVLLACESHVVVITMVHFSLLQKF